MKAHVVTIGDEILSGQITDLNAPFIASALKEIGIKVTKMSSVGDNATDLKNILASHTPKNNVSIDELEIVFLTGGLGPTEDDITKKVWCDFFEDTLILSNEVLTHIAQLTNAISVEALNSRNSAQGLVPSASEIIFNRTGSAPGIWFLKNQTIFIAMPGVPSEMQCMLKEQVIPKLTNQFTFEKDISESIYVYGIAESVLAGLLQDLETKLLLNNVTFAYLPKPGRVQLQLKTNKLREILDSSIKALEIVLDKADVTYSIGQVAEVHIAALLTQSNSLLALAESCTGGSLAAVFTSRAGASNFFTGSMVTYATKAKETILSVKAQTISEDSVVSKNVVEQMAIGAKQLLKSDFALATTGFVGGVPKGEKGKSGQVWFAIALPTPISQTQTPLNLHSENTTITPVIQSWCFDFNGSREFVTQKAVQKAIELLYKEVLKHKKKKN